MIPKGLTIWLSFVILQLPILFMIKLYVFFVAGWSGKVVIDRVGRNSWGFRLFFWGPFMLFGYLPLWFVLKNIVLLLDCVFYYLFGLPVFIFARRCPMRRYKEDQAKIGVYRGGPYVRPDDILM